MRIVQPDEDLTGNSDSSEKRDEHIRNSMREGRMMELFETAYV